jgi:hypothetical protein
MMMPLLFVVAAATACLCTAEVFGVGYRRLAFERRDESFRDFQAYFRRSGVHADVLLAAQEYFEQVTGVRGFPMRPSDDLLAVYQLHREDVQDAVAVVAAGAHCLSVEVTAPEISEGITSVEDLVYAVHRLYVHELHFGPGVASAHCGQERLRAGCTSFVSASGSLCKKCQRIQQGRAGYLCTI